MILPYLDKVCIDRKDLRWFDLHCGFLIELFRKQNYFPAQCGTEIFSSTILRRDLITLTHYHVLDILTNVQEPKCVYNEIKGVKADLVSVSQMNGTGCRPRSSVRACRDMVPYVENG